MKSSMKTISLTLREAEHCKRLSDPTASHLFHLEAFVPFTEAAKLDRGNANVRPPNPRRPAFRAMLESAESTPEAFHLKNRGITYFAEKFQFDNASKTLTVVVPRVAEANDDDAPKYGIADGGHTFAVIEDINSRLAELRRDADWSEPFVRIHLLAGDRASIAEDEQVVEALNTSTQVQQYTLDEYAEKFDALKDALSEQGFDTSLVAFRENEDKPWHVVEIVQRLACFLPDRWRVTQPASMYRSKGKALELFTGEKTRTEFLPLFGVVKDVITLPEFLQAELSSGELVNRRSVAQLRAAKPLPEPLKRPGTPYETRHQLDNAALLPMASAFRVLLRLREGRYEWKVDPKEAFRACAADLHQVLVTRSRKARVISHLGSDVEFWSACVNIVMQAKDRLLDKA
jgi:hypothetical protein